MLNNKKIKTKKIGNKKYRYCLDCEWEESEHRIKYPRLNKDNKIDVKSAEECCKRHEQVYSHHRCKPKWCGGCGNLKIYSIKINHRGSSHVKPRND